MFELLYDKNADIGAIAEQAITDKNLLKGLVDGLKVKNENYRYNCSKVLHIISKNHGELLYPYWDALAEMLKSVNSLHKMCVIHLIADMIPVDKDNRFDSIFNTYFSLLDDKSVAVAYYIAEASGKIINARPELDAKITNLLLDIDKTHHPAGRKELVKAGIIASFDTYFENYAGKSAILDFVSAQTNSESNKTKKAAKAFLKKWEE